MRKLIASAVVAMSALFAGAVEASTVTLTTSTTEVISGGDVITAGGTVTAPTLSYSYAAIASESLNLTQVAFTVDQTQYTTGESLTYSIDGGASVAATYGGTFFGIDIYYFPDIYLAAGETITFTYSVSSVTANVSDYGLGMNAVASPVPLPAAGGFLLLGAGALAFVSRRRKAA